MKNIKKFFMVSLLLLQITSLNSINITKLVLKAACIQNNTEHPQTFTVTFHEKCKECPRLHGTHTKQFVVSPGNTHMINKASNAIQSITLSNQSLHLNMQKEKRRNYNLFTIDTEKKRDFPLHVDFDDTLKYDEQYKMVTIGHEDYTKSLPKEVDHKTFFKKIKELYEKNNLKKRVLSQKDVPSRPKISRIIHTIWFGGHKMPRQFKTWLSKWKVKHSGWIFMLWNKKRIKEKFSQGLVNQQIYNEAQMMYDYATMSKVARYEILKRYGGLYIDPDLQCYENFQPLHYAYDFYVGLGRFYKSFGAVNNGIIGAKRNHPILQKCIDLIKACKTKPGGLYDWTACNLAVEPLTKAVYELAGIQNNVDVVFPRSFFDGNDAEKEFNHTNPIYQAVYTHIQHKPEAFCSRGVYSYVKTQS